MNIRQFFISLFDDIFTVTREEKEDKVFLIVENTPKPKGNIKEFYRYIHENLKCTEKANEMGLKGHMRIQMIVDKDGALTDFKVLKGIGAGCNEDAIRVLKNAPKWKPGKQGGGKTVKVRVILMLPIGLKID